MAGLFVGQSLAGEASRDATIRRLRMMALNATYDVRVRTTGFEGDRMYKAVLALAAMALAALVIAIGGTTAAFA